MKYKNILKGTMSIFLIWTFLFFTSCGNSQNKTNVGLMKEGFEIAFNLRQPDRTITLPKELEEISGLAMLNDSTLLSIDDEKAILYGIFIPSEKIEELSDFGEDDDYEAVAKYKDEAFILESNGNIKEVNLITMEKTAEYDTYLSKRNDVEGATVLPNTDTILIACKDEMENEKKGRRGVYAFDLRSKKLNEKPFYTIDLMDDIKELKNSVHLDNPIIKISIKSRLTQFAPSAIDVDPITNNIYVLSSRGRLLVVLDRSGEMLGVYFLGHRDFGQPEGICFNSSGDLFISNEARSRKANVQIFKRITE